MRRSILFLMAALIFAAVACTKETDNQVVSEKDLVIMSFDATLGASTKTELGEANGAGGYKVLWSKGDKITVVANDESVTDGYDNGVEFTTDIESANTSAIFSGQLVEGDSYYALYPYNANHRWYYDNDKFSAVFKTSQVAGNLENGLAIAKSENGKLDFKHVCGYIKFEIPADLSDIKTVTFAGNADETIGGRYVYVDMNASPMHSVSSGNVVKELTLTPASGDVFAPGTYYIAALPADLESGFTLTFTTSDDKVAEKSTDKPASIQAGHILNLGEMTGLEFDVQDNNKGIAALYEIVTSTNSSSPDSYMIDLVDAVVTKVNGNNVYIEDLTGGILVYKSGHGLSEKDKLTGTLTGKAYRRYGTLQISDIDLTQIDITETTTLPETTLTITELLSNYDRYLSMRVRIVGAVVVDPVSNTDRNGEVEQSGSSINLYSGASNLVEYTKNTNIDFVCYPAYYNDIKQVYVWDDPEVNLVCAEPEISCENNIVTISCATEDVAVYYTIDGNIPTSASTPYSGPFEITESCTVQAIAIKTGYQSSPVALQYCERQAFLTEKININFADYAAGTQYAENEEHRINDILTIYTTQCHFTTQLRLYSSSTHNGYVVSNALPGSIVGMSFNAGNKKDILNVYGSTDGNNWILVEGIQVTSTSYLDYEVDFGDTNYTYFKLDVAGENQIRIASMSVEYKKN